MERKEKQKQKINFPALMGISVFCRSLKMSTFFFSETIKGINLIRNIN